eukprot:4235491-Pyramimonas_sp.AAC.1
MYWMSKGYSADAKGYSVDAKGYSVDAKGYSADAKGYSSKVMLLNVTLTYLALRAQELTGRSCLPTSLSSAH